MFASDAQPPDRAVSHALRLSLLSRTYLSKTIGELCCNAHDITTLEHLTHMDPKTHNDVLETVDAVSSLLRWRHGRLRGDCEAAIEEAKHRTRSSNMGFAQGAVGGVTAGGTTSGDMPKPFANQFLLEPWEPATKATMGFKQLARACNTGLITEVQTEEVVQLLLQSEALAKQNHSLGQQTLCITDPLQLADEVEVTNADHRDNPDDDQDDPEDVAKDDPEDDVLKILKAAKKTVRDVVLWRIVGYVLGQDSREAMEACLLPAIAKHDQAKARLLNGWQKLKEPTAREGKKSGRQRNRGTAASTAVAAGTAAASPADASTMRLPVGSPPGLSREQ